MTAIIADADGLLIVSPMVAAESDYMLFTRLGTPAARPFAADVAAEAYELPEWTAACEPARIARSAQDSFGGPAWRWSTATWWRKIKISASLARSGRASKASQLNARSTAR